MFCQVSGQQGIAEVVDGLDLFYPSPRRAPLINKGINYL